MAKVAKLKIIKPINVDWSVFGDLMRDLDYIGWKIKNRTITRYHDLVTKELAYNDENEKRMNGELCMHHLTLSNSGATSSGSFYSRTG